MARPDPARADRGRRAEAADRAGLAARDDLEPGDLREGDPRERRVRRAALGARASRARAGGDLRRDRRHRRPARGRRAAIRLRRDRRIRRLRIARGRSDARARRRGDARSGQGVLATRGPPQPDDQDPGHRRGPARDRAGDLRGHQRERDAAVRRRGLHPGHGAVHPRARGPPLPRRLGRHPLGRELLRLACGQRRGQAARAIGSRGPVRARRARQRPRGVCALQGDLPRRSLRRAEGRRRAGAAPALGLDRSQEPCATRTRCT